MSQAPRPPLPLVVQVVDVAVERTRARLEPHLDAWARGVPRSLRTHAVDVVLVILVVTGAAGGAVLWIALLWSVAVLVGPFGVPPWATLSGLALVHLASGGVVAARLETRARAEQAALSSTTSGEPASEATGRLRDPTPRRARGARGRSRLPAPYRWLLAGLAVGFALGRARR